MFYKHASERLVYVSVASLHRAYLPFVLIRPFVLTRKVQGNSFYEARVSRMKMEPHFKCMLHSRLYRGHTVGIIF